MPDLPVISFESARKGKKNENILDMLKKRQKLY